MKRYPRKQARPSAPRSVRLAQIMIVAGAISGPGWLPAVHAQGAETASHAVAQRQYDIPAGPLNGALARFGAESGIALVGATPMTQGKLSPGLKGSYTVQEGVAMLLTGTGLEVYRQADGSYGLRLAAPGAPEATLEPVTVRTDAGDATEGTGSYVAGKVRSATGLNLSSRETPQSISVVTRQQIDDQGYVTASDALAGVTGVHGLAWDTKRTYYWVRGFSVDRISYDGVVSNSFEGGTYGGNSQDLAFYDRVEVVRGATGLLSGAGEPSATINYVRKRADSRTLQGQASVGLGSWNDRRATVDLSTPLTASGDVRARVVAVAQEKESFRDYYKDSKRALYAIVEADVGPQTRLSLGVDYQGDRPTGATWGGLPLLYADGSRTDWRRSMNEGAYWSYWDSTNQSVFADLDHRFGQGWRLKGNLTYRQMEYDTKLVYPLGMPDGSTGEGVFPYNWKGDSVRRQLTASLQASGPFSLFGREHEVIAGLNSGRQRAQDNSWNLVSAAALGDYRQWDGSYPEPVWGSATAGETAHTRENAAYVATRLSLSEPLKLILGGRLTSWRNTVADVTRSNSEFTPYAGVIYNLGRSHSLYASYTEIFNPQDYRDVNGNYLDPATGSNYEIGLKGDYFGGRLTASAALFQTRQKNVAVQDGTNLVPGSTSYAYIGADGVKSRGIEAEVVGELLPGWNLSAGISRTLAKNADGSVFSPEIPRTLVKAATSWHPSGDWHRLTVGGNVQWQNAAYYDIAVGSGTYRYEQPAYAVVGLMARYDFSPQLSVQLNANNIFDKKYWLYFSGQGTYGDPRNFLATLNYRF